MDMNDMDKIIHDADEANNCLPADRLRSFIERIEHLEEEKKGIQDDIKDVYAELREMLEKLKADYNSLPQGGISRATSPLSRVNEIIANKLS